MKNILLTGVTGFLGKVILDKLILQNPDCNVYCIVRAKTLKAASERMSQYYQYANIHVLKGDISESNLDLSEEDYSFCIQHIDTIIHCAASTRFNAPMKHLERQNIFATKEMVDLAKQIVEHKKVRPVFVYISTAYQAGKSDNLIEEKFIDKPVLGFKNNYEKSKWICEQIIKEEISYAHYLILRPSIIMAHDTGKCYADGVGIGVFELLNKKSKRFPSIVPVNRKLLLDFVSVDFIAKATIDLLNNISVIPNGSVFHLTDTHGGMTGKEGIIISNKSFGIKLFGVNVRWVKMMVKVLTKYTNIIKPRDIKILDAYLDYFGTNPTFELINLAKYTGKDSMTLRSGEVYQRAIKYWKGNILKSE